MKILRLVMVLLLSSWFVACDQSSETVEQVSISVNNLPALPAGGGHYQMWVRYYIFNKVSAENSPLHEGEYIGLGEFNVAEDGTLRSPDAGPVVFNLPAGSDPQLLSDIIIAVQTPHGLAKVNHDEPGSILIGGKFYGDATTAIADLNITFGEAFRTDFSSASGKCTIVSPTSPPDSNSGVWFVELASAPTVGLRNLPALPAKWRYEGWVVQELTGNSSLVYHSTGKFARPDSADYDGAGPNGGTAGAGYNFPGQDFVTGAFHPNLTAGYRFLVTVEPFPDNSPSPFFLHLLMTPSESATRTQTLQNIMFTSAPTARIVIRR